MVLTKGLTQEQALSYKTFSKSSRRQQLSPSPFFCRERPALELYSKPGRKLCSGVWYWAVWLKLWKDTTVMQKSFALSHWLRVCWSWSSPITCKWCHSLLWKCRHWNVVTLTATVLVATRTFPALSQRLTYCSSHIPLVFPVFVFHLKIMNYVQVSLVISLYMSLYKKTQNDGVIFILCNTLLSACLINLLVALHSAWMRLGKGKHKFALNNLFHPFLPPFRVWWSIESWAQGQGPVLPCSVWW